MIYMLCYGKYGPPYYWLEIYKIKPKNHRYMIHLLSEKLAQVCFGKKNIKNALKYCRDDGLVEISITDGIRAFNKEFYSIQIRTHYNEIIL